MASTATKLFAGSHHQSFQDAHFKAAGNDIYSPTYNINFNAPEHFSEPPGSQANSTVRSVREEGWSRLFQQISGFFRSAENRAVLVHGEISAQGEIACPMQVQYSIRSTPNQGSTEDAIANDSSGKDSKPPQSEDGSESGQSQNDCSVLSISNLDPDSISHFGATTNAGIYTRNMLSATTAGLACWHPQPRKPVGETGIVPGDVGTFNLTHGFKRIFNIWEDESLPDVARCQLPLKECTTHPEEFAEGHTIASGTSSKACRSPDANHITGFEFRCQSQQGAVLACTTSADLEALVDSETLRDFLIQHAGIIYRHANSVRRIADEDPLYIVSGCIKSDSWALAAYKDPAAAPDDLLTLSRRNTNTDVPVYDWIDRGTAEARFGSNSAARESGAYKGKDQCLFLQGFKLALSPKFRARLKGLRLPVGDDQHHGLEDASRDAPSNSSNQGTAGHGPSGDIRSGLESSHSTEKAKDNDGPQSDEFQIDDFPVLSRAPIFHPCDGINDLLLKTTGADCALSHDDDWRKRSHEISPWTDDLCFDIITSRAIVARNGVAWLLSRDEDLVMSPPSYRSSYMANKMEKTDSYRDSLGIVGGRPSTKLGRHLSRIAGSDKEDWMDGTNPDYSPLRREDLAGRRKKRLAKLSDMIQAYEYLCHVGEAQKWIEGCLDKELAFDVVEIEEGLRNGVILAKLVRAFDGEQAVPQIYQAPKLDFRHSANINIFISFVRKEGLPERFIFELADLHDKKNIPKVIYCIHALSHLLFRRGRAEHIGNLLGQLEFSEDQLQRTQKGLKEFGIAGPNFGSVGRELAKDINEEPEVEVETQEERRDRLLLESESSIVQLQACCRAMLLRQSYKSLQARLEFSARHITKVQTHCLGALVRRKLQARRQVQARLQPWAIALQAAALGVLARRRWNAHLQRIKACAPQVKKMQAQICGVLQRRRYAMLKAALQKLDVVTPDVASVQFQAACRRYLVRQEYHTWRTHLHCSHDIATFLQALLRGVMQRRAYQAKLDHYNANISKVVKIQALFRAKETREQYRQLTLVKNVTIGTIKSFVHLLDDSEGDFQEELKVQRLRKRVVESIRENQSLETEVDSFDIKIALVENAQDFVDLVRAKGTYGTVNAASRATRVSLLAVHGDPFFGSHLVDHDTRRKLELYQQLFYILQSRAEYFTRLFTQMSADNVAEAKFVERVVLTVFGYGLGNREDYLLLKLFQFAIRDQIAAASALEEVVNGHPTYINVAFACLRPKQATYARETLQAIIKDVIESDDLDLEVNARTIHRIRIDQEEMRTGVPSHLPKDLPYMEAMEDPQTRFIYIRHLQMLRWWVEQFVTVITQSTKTMPYGIRYLARETLTCLRLKFPDAPERLHIQCIGRLIYSQYIKPVINTPETFDVVSKAVDVQARRNLARISEVLDQVASGVPFDKDSHYYLPINEYVDIAIARMSAWFLEVANVPDAETQYHAHEFLDVTVQPKPIYISPNEIYSLHTILSRHQDQLAGPDDILRVILSELGEAPHLDNEELKDARDTVITLELNDRFAGVRDPDVEEETRWVQAKRGVLAILRVQPAQDLLDSLMGPVTERNELLWEDILEAEMENELKQMPRRQPSAAIPYSAYRLEHIRSLKFAAVKVLAIDNLLELEKQGKITREDGFQGILNAIAGDVRRKHRKRIQRQQEIRSMSEALRQLAERKKHLLAQIDSYDKFVESTMTTIQKGKGKNRFAIPFAKQYSYMRKLGQAPQFGSFKYTAKYLFEKGILLSIDSYSPMKFDRLQITMSSNIAGVFTVVLGSTMLRGVTSEIAKEDIRMEDLLQARFENRRSLSILGGKVKVNLEPFLDRINKKFYS